MRMQRRMLGRDRDYKARVTRTWAMLPMSCCCSYMFLVVLGHLTRIILDEDAHESLQRAKDSTVDHNGALFGVCVTAKGTLLTQVIAELRGGAEKKARKAKQAPCLPNIKHIETFGKVEVQLQANMASYYRRQQSKRDAVHAHGTQICLPALWSIATSCRWHRKS